MPRVARSEYLANLRTVRRRGEAGPETAPGAAGWTVRRARRTDIPDLARINVKAWQSAYRGMIPADLLDGMLPEGQHGRWESWLARPEPDVVLVAVDEAADAATEAAPAAYCGVCAVRQDGDGDPERPTGELLALYADPGCRGTGAGHAVHEAGLAHLGAAGFVRAVLWVLRDNVAAQRFYAAHGWRPDGVTGGFRAGGYEVPEVRYSRDLARPGAAPHQCGT